ncbi:protein phosphatase 2C domain-containing protein [Streptomyces asoensis]|uniref:protein phosphatase 2C domain-containing protein n=1 Tax=Streptomyces asoensis TaxID=249586 RepID=UPI0033FB831F
MSQPGGRPTGHEDDWWGQLYDDDTAEDTGPARTGDSLDDRFASAAGAVRPAAGTGDDAGPQDGAAPRDPESTGGPDGPGAPGTVPAPRAQPPDPAGSGDWWAAPAGAAGPTGNQPSPEATVPPPRTHPPAESGPGRDTARAGGPGHRPPGAGRGDGSAGAPRDEGRDEADRADDRGSGPSAGVGPGAVGTGGAGTGPGMRPPGRQPAPWEPPPATPAGPTSFPAGPLPPGFPHRAGPSDPGPRASASADAGPASGRAPLPVPSPPPPPSAPPVPPPPPAAPPAGPPGTAGQDPGSSPAPVRSAPPPPATPPVPAQAPSPPNAPTVSVDGAAGSLGPTDPPPAAAAPADRRPTVLDVAALPDPTDHIGSGPPTYDAEPTALPPADPDDLDDLVADTVLDGARYGVFALRAASVRGDSARYRGEPRRDSLLTARFGTGEHALVLVAMATGARATPGAHRAAAEVCRWIAQAVGRSHVRLAQDIRAARRGDLKSGLHRLTDRSLGRLRAGAAEQGLEPDEYAATLRCLLLPADPACRTRVFFGVGAGGLFRLRDGVWRDIEPQVSEVAGEPVLGFGSLPAETPEGDRLTMDLGITTPPNPYDPDPGPPREPFRFRASVARPGDTLLMCSTGLAEPLRGEPELSAHLSGRWSDTEPPGLAAFLADTQVRVKGYADDRTAAAVWEA